MYLGHIWTPLDMLLACFLYIILYMCLYSLVIVFDTFCMNSHGDQICEALLYLLHFDSHTTEIWNPCRKYEEAPARPYGTVAAIPLAVKSYLSWNKCRSISPENKTSLGITMIWIMSNESRSSTLRSAHMCRVQGVFGTPLRNIENMIHHNPSKILEDTWK